jgi:hypothetical protein
MTIRITLRNGSGGIIFSTHLRFTL